MTASFLSQPLSKYKLCENLHISRVASAQSYPTRPAASSSARIARGRVEFFDAAYASTTSSSLAGSRTRRIARRGDRLLRGERRLASRHRASDYDGLSGCWSATSSIDALAKRLGHWAAAACVYSRPRSRPGDRSSGRGRAPVGFIAAVLPAIAVAVPVRPRGFARYTYFVNPLVSATGIASTCFFAVPDGTATNVYAHITGTHGPVRAVAGTLFVR
jgi:hypothetical protein